MVYIKVTQYVILCPGVQVSRCTKVFSSSTHGLHPSSHGLPHGSEYSQAESEDLKGMSLAFSPVLQAVN